MDYFSLSKVKQNVFKQREKQKERNTEEVGLKRSSFSWVFRYFEQPLGTAVPALVGVRVLLVLNLNTNEEELVMRAFGEEHSVKTAAHIYKGIG